MASKRQIWVGDVAIGGGAPVVVQTMTKTETANLEATMEQIEKVAEAGADIVRVAVPRDDDVVAGAFRTWTVPDGPRRWADPFLHLADIRSRITSHPYGDQAMFVRAEAFAALGGFPEQALMEDYELSRRLGRIGRIETVGARVTVSGRRFQKRPLLYTLLVNVYPLLYRAGVSPDALARLYKHCR